MINEDIIRMAREAGVPDSWNLNWFDPYYERFAAIAYAAGAAAEREECAKVCEAIAQEMYDQGEGPTGYISWVADCHLRIRARGQS